MADTRRRAIIAVLVGTLCAVVGIAGGGHAYLREWRRAVAWFSFVLGVSLVLLSVFADPATVTLSNVPDVVLIPVAILLLLSTLDAYFVARRRQVEDSEGRACPSCRRTVDPEMAFCWYCAERLDSTTPENVADGLTSR